MIVARLIDSQVHLEEVTLEGLAEHDFLCCAPACRA